MRTFSEVGRSGSFSAAVSAQIARLESRPGERYAVRAVAILDQVDARDNG